MLAVVRTRKRYDNIILIYGNGAISHNSILHTTFYYNIIIHTYTRRTRRRRPYSSKTSGDILYRNSDFTRHELYIYIYDSYTRLMMYYGRKLVTCGRKLNSTNL